MVLYIVFLVLGILEVYYETWVPDWIKKPLRLKALSASPCAADLVIQIMAAVQGTDVGDLGTDGDSVVRDPARLRQKFCSVCLFLYSSLVTYSLSYKTKLPLFFCNSGRRRKEMWHDKYWRAMRIYINLSAHAFVPAFISLLCQPHKANSFKHIL